MDADLICFKTNQKKKKMVVAENNEAKIRGISKVNRMKIENEWELHAVRSTSEWCK